MPSPFLQALDRRVLVLDGAMGTSLHQCHCDLERDYLGKENCSEILVQTRPDVVQGIHESFLEAGADAVETNTFGGGALVLAEFDLADQTRALNRQAAEIARAACERHSSADKPRFALGSIGPGTKLLTLGHTDWDAMLRSYTEQVRGLLDGGVDALLIETCQDILQVKCALCACLDALAERGRSPEDVPLLVSVTIETTGTMLLGTEITAAATTLASYPIASLGLNCATGPGEMAEHIRFLSHRWDRHISVVPNAGLPALVDGQTVYPLAPEPFVDALERYVVEEGVSIVGGCCGTTPEHIRLLAERVGGRPRSPRAVEPLAPGTASLYSPVEHRQEASSLLVGERTNTNGSRKFKRLLSEEDWEGVVSMARELVREGSHVLDVCVDFVGRDGRRDMAEVVSRLAAQVQAPLMIDSTEPEVIEAGLQRAPGKAVINSANLEEGEAKFARLCRLAKRYGAAIVLGTIDEDPEEAMAKTAERKLAIAQRMFTLATEEHGLAPADLFFDPLVLPITTGVDADRRLALETIEGTRLIAQALPECQIIVGLSNVSFGLAPAARVVLNSVFLHELEQAGLTAAIVHVSKILPQSRIDEEQWSAALDLLYDRRREGFDPLTRFIELFEDVEDVAAASGPALADLPLEERLRQHIIEGEQQGLAETLDEALTKYSPLDIINDHLLEGMKVVGERFGAGQMQLPFVLQSAQVMKAAVARLEPHMEKSSGASKGRIVLATVQGDVHDIGKNLVDIILTNNGYEVINLGIKQPLANIIRAFEEHQADAIGLSGLLVKSVGVMQSNLEELRRLQWSAPVILGGAALNRHYAERDLRSVYPRTYYGRDAFEGLRFMDLLSQGRLEELDREIEQRLAKREAVDQRVAASAKAQEGGSVAVAPVRSDVAADVDVPTPPFYGVRVVQDVPLQEVYPYVNTVALFRGQWQFRKGAMSDEEYAALLRDTVEPLFQRLQQQCLRERLLRPAVVYGYFPVQSQGDDLIVFDPEDHDREIERFHFPRQKSRRRLCIADFFRSVESGEKDVLGLSCVTMGAEASRRARALFEENNYTEYLYLHGMSVECAEALAELWHKRMRQELSIAGDDAPTIRELFVQRYRGSRYSPGYPACPDMRDQEKIFRLLRPERIGCTLTENWQIDPEQSTSAFIVHHPQAKYFNV